MAEQVLSIMEIILDESNAEPLNEDKVRGASLSADTGSTYCISLPAAGLFMCPVVSTKND